LPTGAGGAAPAMYAGILRKALSEWSERSNCEIKTAVTTRDRQPLLTVEFKREQDLTVFALSWTMSTFRPWQRC